MGWVKKVHKCVWPHPGGKAVYSRWKCRKCKKVWEIWALERVGSRTIVTWREVD